MNNKIKTISSLLCLLSMTQANASYAPMTSIKNLGDQKFHINAFKTETNSFKINETTGILKTSLTNINQKQVMSNLSVIENMQANAGSGLYFKQSRNNFNSIEENGVDTQGYQNTFSGKFSLDSEHSIMATINEGKNSLEQITLLNGLVDEAETKSLGLSLAFNKKLDAYNIFAFIGKNWISNDFDTLGKMSGEQMHLGLGANYKTMFENLTFVPQVNIQKIKSSLKNTSEDFYMKGDNSQTTATIGVRTNYRINNYFTFGASVNYEKDISANNAEIINENLENKFNSQENFRSPNERYGVALSLVYNPIEKMNVVMDFKHKINSNGNDKEFNVGVRYNF